MPQPGEPLVRRRSKGPALTRTMSSTPLVPPSEPTAPVNELTEMCVNPHLQLQLVEVWLIGLTPF